MACAFVTGIAGFVGNHLCDYLLRQGCTIAGTDMAEGWSRPSVTYDAIDILNTSALASLLARTQPEYV
jgi:nucleoside-diphosphate-sugar epimerase